jgi:hypothetical protein
MGPANWSSHERWLAETMGDHPKISESVHQLSMFPTCQVRVTGRPPQALRNSWHSKSIWLWVRSPWYTGEQNSLDLWMLNDVDTLQK